ALKRPCDLSPDTWNGVRAKQLHLRQKRRVDIAIERARKIRIRRIEPAERAPDGRCADLSGDRAIVRRRTSGAHTALQGDLTGQADVDGAVDAIPVLNLVPDVV